MEEQPSYRNFISNIDVDRDINNIVFFDFDKSDYKIREFQKDMTENNDVIEKNLIETNAYKEAIVLSLKKSKSHNGNWKKLLREEQKTFSGSKLFYLNEDYTRMLILSVPGNSEGKVKMVINRLNKVNEKINRLNLKIKKENQDTYNERLKENDQKDKIINLINLNLRV